MRFERGFKQEMEGVVSAERKSNGEWREIFTGCGLDERVVPSEEVGCGTYKGVALILNVILDFLEL